MADPPDPDRSAGSAQAAPAQARSRQFLTRRSFGPGDKIIQEGHPGDVAYFIQEGRVSVFKDHHGSAVHITDLKEGEIFGEMALIAGEPRMATVRAATSTVCVVINQDMLDKKLATTDPLVTGLFKVFVTKIRQLTAQTSELRKAKLAEPSTPDELATMIKRYIDRAAYHLTLEEHRTYSTRMNVALLSMMEALEKYKA